jgi:hypothetical protein
MIEGKGYLPLSNIRQQNQGIPSFDGRNNPEWKRVHYRMMRIPDIQVPFFSCSNAMSIRRDDL